MSAIGFYATVNKMTGNEGEARVVITFNGERRCTGCLCCCAAAVQGVLCCVESELLVQWRASCVCVVWHCCQSLWDLLFATEQSHAKNH
jgi:hypothetical protein